MRTLKRRTLLAALLGACGYGLSQQFGRNRAISNEQEMLARRLLAIVAPVHAALASTRLSKTHFSIEYLMTCLLKPATGHTAMLHTYNDAARFNDQQLCERIRARIADDYSQNLMVKREGWWLSLTEAATLDLLAVARTQFANLA